MLLIQVWTSSFICKIAKLSLSTSYLLFHFNMLIKAVDLFFMTKYALTYHKQNKMWINLVIVSIWVSAMLFGIIIFVKPTPDNVLCSFHRFEQGLMNLLFLCTFYILIPVVVHILVIGLMLSAVSYVRSSSKEARGSDVSTGFIMNMVLSFGLKHLYFLLLLPFLILEFANFNIWSAQGKWEVALLISCNGLINPGLINMKKVFKVKK